MHQRFPDFQQRGLEYPDVDHIACDLVDHDSTPDLDPASGVDVDPAGQAADNVCERDRDRGRDEPDNRTKIGDGQALGEQRCADRDERDPGCVSDDLPELVPPVDVLYLSVDAAANDARDGVQDDGDDQEGAQSREGARVGDRLPEPSQNLG